jgi:hypothetical protein
MVSVDNISALKKNQLAYYFIFVQVTMIKQYIKLI